MNYPWFKPFNNKLELYKKIPNFIQKNKITMGNYSYKLEKKLKKILKVKHVVLTTSGTSALMMATLALGIKGKTKVICTNMTWIASINPSLICGADLHLVDTIKASQKVDFIKLNKLIKKVRPDVVILVHLCGEPVYNKEFDSLKKKFKFKVIEDAAQSFLVKDENKKFVGTKYDVGCFSLSITKIINMVYGGFCVTNNSNLARKLISIRNNGVNAEPENAKLELASQPGLNLKPSDLHSYIGLLNLNKKNNILARVNELFLLYKKKLNNKNIKLLEVNFLNKPTIYVSALIKNKLNFEKFCKKNKITIHLGTRCIHETNICRYH